MSSRAIFSAFILAGVFTAAGVAQTTQPATSIAVRVNWTVPANAKRGEALMPAVARHLKNWLDGDGANRFTVSSPAPGRLTVQVNGSPDALVAFSKLQRAEAAFNATGLGWPRILKAIRTKDADRAAAIASLFPREDPRAKTVANLAKLDTAYRTARQSLGKEPEPASRQQVIDLHDELEKAEMALEKQTLESPALYELLDAHPTKEIDGQLEALPSEYPGQADAIRQVLAARKRLTASDPKMPSPHQLAAAIEQGGQMEFRIAVQPSDADRLTLADAWDDFLANGPDAVVKLPAGEAGWFALDPHGDVKPADVDSEPIINAVRDGRTYVLLRTDSAGALVHDNSRMAWSATVSGPMTSGGGICLPFRVDASGSVYLSELTSTNLSRSMAAMCGDRVEMIPRINSEIRDVGGITFGRGTTPAKPKEIRRKAEELHQSYLVGALPYTLTVMPGSEK